MNKSIIKTNIKNYIKHPCNFDKQLKNFQCLKNFQEKAESKYISIKRQSFTTALKEAVTLKETTYYAIYNPNDDVVELFYMPK